MSYRLTVDISANSEGLVYALLTDTSSNTYTYTSQGYTAGQDSSYNKDDYLSYTQDVVTHTSDVLYECRISKNVDTSGNFNGFISVFGDLTNTTYGETLTAINYIPIEGQSNTVKIPGTYINSTGSGYGYNFVQTLLEESQDVSGVFTLYDSSYNNYGTVTYDPSNNRITATNDIDTRYNYQNISIIANCALCKYFDDNANDNYTSPEVNAMYAVNASVFNNYGSK